MSFNGLNEYLLYLIGLVIALLGFRTLKKTKNPKTIISRTLAKTKYKDYTCWITQQSALETGYWKSKIFKEFNNGFGMGVARVRDTNRIGTYLATNGEEFSTYRSFEDSVKDYVLWADYFRMPTNFIRPQQFVDFLEKKGYAEDPNYADKVFGLIEDNC